MKNRLLILMSILFLSSGAYSQACDCFLTIDSTFQRVPMSLGTDTGAPPHYWCNDCSGLPIKLPFKFCFYGKTYDTVYVNNKGTLTFVNPDFTFSSKGFPASDTAMLAPFWANIDNRPFDDVSSLIDFAAIYYKVTPTHLIVQWNTVGYNTFDDDAYDNFQVIITNGADPILSAGNNVSYCYWLMEWASADSSGGSAGFNGTPASMGVNKGDNVNYAQMGKFSVNNSTYGGPFYNNSGVDWLDNKSFIFNTCVSGNNIPPVIMSPNLCDTITICAGDTTVLTAAFLCPQQGQKATISVFSPGLSELKCDTGSVTSIYVDTLQLIPTQKDTGTHTITIVASDNGTPSLKDSISYTVFIQACGDTVGLGVDKVTKNKSFSIYPNPNNGKFTIELASGALDNGNSHIEIYNMLGQQVYSQFSTFSTPLPINLSSQASGVYFYRIVDGSGYLLSNGKLVINN